MMYLGKDPVGLNVIELRTNWLKYVKGAYGLFSYATFPSTNVVIDFEGATISADNLSVNTAYMFAATNAVNITIKNLNINNVQCTSMFADSRASGSGSAILETITFDNCSIAPNTITSCFRYLNTLTTVSGEIDLTNCTNSSSFNSTFQNCNALTSMRIKANSIKIDAPFNIPPFDDSTLVNIGNALDGTVTGKTLTLLADKKTRCGTLMGTNNSGTFVADENGTMSLETFIASVKGWTLA